eukprot:GAHX01000605.1.p1 GENE.GAHX01000605.1~~GAHX01000605.1.p1  ORF type:complete len:992 (-),score=193.88 GAHX01000605.1:1573-4548(-)
MSEKQELEKVITTSEIKKKAREEFSQNPSQFYPTTIFEKYGFVRKNCPICKNNYWATPTGKTNCGDCTCNDGYYFIREDPNKVLIKNTKGIKEMTIQEANQAFIRSFKSAKIPHTNIRRYPVVARWRDDVNFVNAGIYCFQPFCVSGEVNPPANPLICSQPCLRFNDLDNIGLTGRHYSCFFMLGIQVFNYPENFIYFKDECVDFNLRFLIEELGVDTSEITLIEDVWAGGGNLGPSIEYFFGGLEVGNMVFMQYRVDASGAWEELPVKVIDVGIGLERIPWVMSGLETSYLSSFPNSSKLVSKALGVDLDKGKDVYRLFSKYSYRFNVDEVDPESLNNIYTDLANLVKSQLVESSVTTEEIVEIIKDMRDVFICCDHARTIMISLNDGALPSNEGGYSNIRIILRRVFYTLTSRLTTDSDKLKFKDECCCIVMEIFRAVIVDLKGILNDISIEDEYQHILDIEYQRWAVTDVKQTAQLKKFKNKKLSMEDWVVAVSSWGISPDKIAQATNQSVPPNLYLEISEASEKTAKQAKVLNIPKEVEKLGATKCLYFDEEHRYTYDFSAVLLFNKVDGDSSSLFMNQTMFYPTSGGQLHDKGTVSILKDGRETYKGEISEVLKLGKYVEHVVQPKLDVSFEDIKTGKYTVQGHVEPVRRELLRKHHTAAHILYASSRKVLGKHVWQSGAKKSPTEAHLDITHYKILSVEETTNIEKTANIIIARGLNVNTYFQSKDEAELEYGFSIYQGGVVPGDTLRIVSIDGLDTEACCGTHCMRTSEVGPLRIVKTARISDGVVRINFCIGERAAILNENDRIVLQTINRKYNITSDRAVDTISRFFSGYKKYLTAYNAMQTNMIKAKTDKLKELIGSNNRLVIETENVFGEEALNRSAIKTMKDYDKAIKSIVTPDSTSVVMVLDNTFFYCFYNGKEGFNELFEEIKKEGYGELESKNIKTTKNGNVVQLYLNLNDMNRNKSKYAKLKRHLEKDTNKWVFI